jgi:hypothetical protein
MIFNVFYVSAFVHDQPVPQVANGRFAAPLSESEIENKKKETIPKNTQSANSWATAVWRDWARFRNTHDSTIQELGSPIPEDIGDFMEFCSMDFWMQRFVHEIRRQDGKPYPPETLKQITAGLQRYLRNEKNMPVNFFKCDDPTFAGFYKALDCRMRELTNEGVGLEKKSASPVLVTDEKQFWDTGVFSMDSAVGLSNAVFYYNGKVFGLRGGNEHIGLLAEQFSFGYDTANQRKFVKYTPRIRKNAQGGLKQSKAMSALMTPIVHYDRPGSECSVYNIFEKYLALIPKVGSFYRKPLDGFRFSANNIAQRDLKGMMKRFFSEAGISTDNRNISNHSGRVTLCSTLYNQKFSDKSVMSRSKHSSNSVHVYQKEDFSLSDNICLALEPPETSTSKPVKCEPQSTPRRPLTEINNNIPSFMDKKDIVCHDSGIGNDILEIKVPSNVSVIVIEKDGKKMKLEL